MSNDPHNTNLPAHGDFERRDISTHAVLYFLLSLVIGGVFIYFIASGIFHYLDKHYLTEQPQPNPLSTQRPSDTRRIPPQYGDDYEKYLKEDFPAPQLETDERTELNAVRLREENILSTYGWVDQKSGVVHIPIDRAMDLLVEHGLPVRPGTEMSQSKLTEGTKK